MEGAAVVGLDLGNAIIQVPGVAAEGLPSSANFHPAWSRSIAEPQLRPAM